MKNFKYLTILAAVLIGTSAFGQQTPRFSNYLFNKVIINPAAAGSNEYMEVMGSYRKQWVGFDGAPATSFLSFDGSVLQRRLGVGVQVINDRIGALNSTGAVLTAAPRVRLARESFLSFGVSLGMFNNKLQGSELTYKDANETAIPGANESANILDLKAGLYFKNKKYFAGVSAFNIFEPVIEYSGNEQSQGSVLERHYYFMGGRIFSLNNVWDLVPSLQYKLSEQGQDQLDINLRAMYNNFIGLGVSLRGKESVSLMMELIPTPIFRFGYAYDLSTNSLRNEHSGSHEIMVAYRFIQSKNLTENPRFLFN
jgi:type IX secretion system PorP/SprF family membrane protein